MIFNTMFERAAIFSAIFIFIVFGILGIKYLDFMEAKVLGNSTAVINSP